MLARIAGYTLAAIGACALMITTANAAGLVHATEIKPRPSAQKQNKHGALTAARSSKKRSLLDDAAVAATRGQQITAENRDDAEMREREEEIARYRRAAEETLGQLAWCVSYLHRIRRGRIAEGIDASWRHIRREMSGARG